MNKPYLVYTLYGMLAIQVIISLIYHAYIVAVSSITVIALGLILRIIRYTRLNEPTKWKTTRSMLQKTLIESNILPEIEEEKVVSKVLIQNTKQIQDSIIVNNIDFVTNVREIGIDGIVCLLLLLEQQQQLITAPVLRKTLRIPTSTLYRTLQRLQEQNYIQLQYSPEIPEMAFYSLSERGESIIIQLYELLDEQELAYVVPSKPFQ